MNFIELLLGVNGPYNNVIQNNIQLVRTRANPYASISFTYQPLLEEKEPIKELSRRFRSFTSPRVNQKARY